MQIGLGSHWSIVDPGLTVKNYPCCGGTLRALDALGALLSEHKVRYDDVTKLEVDVHPDLLHIVRFHKPTKGFQGKFSIDYVLAAMLLDGRVDLDSFSDAYCNAPRMRAALEKVQVNVHTEWPNDAEARRKQPVTLTMKDGQQYTKLVEKVLGSPGNPMSRDQLVGKYRGCATRVLGKAALEKSIELLEGLEVVPGVCIRRATSVRFSTRSIRSSCSNSGAIWARGRDRLAQSSNFSHIASRGMVREPGPNFL